MDPTIDFPWDRLNGKPLIFASLGTVRNNDLAKFRMITEAAALSDFQLVVALGAGNLSPRDLRGVAADTVVVDFAPQRELFKRTALTINCAGLNTTFDCIAAGVPMVAIPIAEDQPGVAVRIHRAGIGEVIPAKQLTLEKLRRAIATVIDDVRYRVRVQALSREFSAIDGIGMAVGIIEGVLKL